MVDIENVTAIADIVILLIAVLLSLIYLMAIILVRRFHTPINILAGNVCLATIIPALFYALYTILSTYYLTVLYQSIITCYIIGYLSSTVNCLVVYALTNVTINRFFAIIYPNKRLFKTRAWSFISSGIQWIVAIMLPLPQIIVSIQVCIYGSPLPSWIVPYNLFVIVILPSITNGIFNSLIFIKVRSSTRRVHAEPTTTTGTTNPKKSNARDIRLLKHMLFIFVVFIVGWAPSYVIPMINTNGDIPIWAYSVIQILPVFSSLINIVDLFLYNHELRQYLRERLLNRRN